MSKNCKHASKVSKNVIHHKQKNITRCKKALNFILIQICTIQRNKQLNLNLNQTN